MIFQVNRAFTASRMLIVGPGDNFVVEQRACPDTYRDFLCMANYKGETCFVIGGEDEDDNILSSVARYNIAKDKWERRTPALKVARSDAAACSLGDCVFVFAG